jgi:hypothetical protein
METPDTIPQVLFRAEFGAVLLVPRIRFARQARPEAGGEGFSLLKIPHPPFGHLFPVEEGPPWSRSPTFAKPGIENSGYG